ncbi:MAG: sulfur carrier protein ThiS [bacterium]
MTITVNGNKYEHHGDGRVDQLLAELGSNPDAVAIMVNDQVIPKIERMGVVLKDGDRVEVLSFMGGG